MRLSGLEPETYGLKVQPAGPVGIPLGFTSGRLLRMMIAGLAAQWPEL